jgi:hypothetical protein
VNGGCDRCIATENHPCSSKCTSCVDGCSPYHSSLSGFTCIEKTCKNREVNNSVEWGKVCGSGDCYASETGTADGSNCFKTCLNQKYIIFIY